eukprot:1148755-Pelagomonas_calceolata.AAC.3
MHRLHVYVLRELVTDWCKVKRQNPRLSVCFYPSRNTLQTMFTEPCGILRHLVHAARKKKPNSSPRLHVAFIDFKQAYDTIPRISLGSTLSASIRLRTCWLSLRTCMKMMSMCWLTGSSAGEASQRGQARLPSLSSADIFVYQ